MIKIITKSKLNELNRSYELCSDERHTLYCKNVELDDKVNLLSKELASTILNNHAAFSKLVFDDTEILGVFEINKKVADKNPTEERLTGKKLIVITGRRHSPSECKAYYTTNISNCIADFYIGSSFQEHNSYLCLDNFEVSIGERGKDIGMAVLKCIEHRAYVLNDTISQISRAHLVTRVIIFTPLPDSVAFYKKFGYVDSQAKKGALEKIIDINPSIF